MSNGRRSKGGGLGPSNAAAAPRGVLLIVVAVALGVLLLWKGLGASEFAVTPAAEETVTTTTADVTTDTGVDGEPTTVTGIDGEPIETTTTTLFPTVTALPPNEVTVLVANGSGIGGAAGTITDLLKPEGYVTLAPANAEPTGVSGIYYRTGKADEAREVMEVLAPGDPMLIKILPEGGLAVPDETQERVVEADIVVILGSDGLIISE
ncbi:MAG: LytR C-terminal domain-containing protein [Acidimicrobiales bacterium]|nr:LytR C-terminal domain-containing protein [Acidimicrobiales bacterium]